MLNNFPSITGLPSSYLLDSLSVFTETYQNYSKFLNPAKYIRKIIFSWWGYTGQTRKVVYKQL